MWEGQICALFGNKCTKVDRPKIFLRKTQVGFSAIEPLKKWSEIPRGEYAKSMFSARLSGYFSDVSRDYSQISCYFPPDSKKVFLLSQALISIKNEPPTQLLDVSLLLTSISVYCHIGPHFLCVSNFVLIICLSLCSSSFSICLHLNPYFLFVSIFNHCVCLSPSISLFSSCLHLILNF